MSREDQYAVMATIGGRDFGVWDKMGGGDIDSDESKYRPGAMAAQYPLGGSVQVENVTISRNYRLDRDHPNTPWLMANVGKAECTVSKQPLDVDGNAFGKPTVYTGRLKSVTLPDVDSQSTDAGMIELEISSASTVTQ